MGLRSKRKGKRGELEAVHLLRALGFRARRGQQYQGTPESPDVIVEGVDWWIEVKRSESCRIYQWLEEAAARAGGRPILLLWRRNRRPWVGIFCAAQLVELVSGMREAPACRCSANCSKLPGRLS